MNKVILLLAALSLSVWGCRPAQTSEQPEQSLKVKTQKVALFETANPSYIGTVEESVSTPLSFSVPGTVEKVYVSEGDFVQKGQLLATLSNSNLQNTYQMTLSSQKKAEDAYRRLSEIYKKGSLPAIKFVEIETALEQAKAATQIALKNLQDCHLYAPVAGVTGKRSIEPGQNIIPGNPVITLINIDKVFVKTPVPEKELSQIHKGQTATASILALNNEVFNGTVEEIGVIANPVTHTYMIKIALKNPDRKLMPGMVCRVVIEDVQQAGGVIVPMEAVQVDAQGNPSVYLADASGKAIKRSITTGALQQQGVIVTQGLSAGDEVIVEGFQKVSDGMSIETEK